MVLDTFQNLEAKERALIAIAVLLDGREAVTYLRGSDPEEGRIRLAAEDLARIVPEMRMPLLGTLLRTALKDLRDSGRRGST